MLQHLNKRAVQKRSDSDIEAVTKHFTAFLWQCKPFELHSSG